MNHSNGNSKVVLQFLYAILRNLGKIGTGNKGAGNNGTGNKGANGKVGKNGALMLKFPTPQTLILEMSHFYLLCR